MTLYEILTDYTEWLYNSGYVDDDVFLEEPGAVILFSLGYEKLKNSDINELKIFKEKNDISPAKEKYYSSKKDRGENLGGTLSDVQDYIDELEMKLIIAEEYIEQLKGKLNE